MMEKIKMKMDEYFKKLKDAKVPDQIKADRERREKGIGPASDDCHTYS